MNAVEIIAHRGASHDAPENTLASLRLAWEQGADAVEFDVYLSADQRIVLMHDRSLLRTTGVDRSVQELSLEELRTLDVGRWKDPRYTGERIATLEEALSTVPAGKRVLIEVKSGPETLPELQRVIKTAKLAPAQTAVISFDPRVVAECKRRLPEVAVYWIVSLKPTKQPAPTVEQLLKTARRINADGLDLSATPEILTAEYSQALKSAGLGLYVWTVNDPQLARQMLDLGVEGLTTDRPGWLREQLPSRGDSNALPAHDAPLSAKGETPPATAETSPALPLRVMSYNIRYGTADDGPNHWKLRKSLLLQTISKFKPDLLGTQETLAEQRDFLRDNLPGYQVLAVGRDDGREAGEMTAIYYNADRLEKLWGGHFWLSERPDQPGSKSWDTSLTRMASWVKLRDKRQPASPPILFLNTHFDHRGEQAQLESARLIRRKLTEIGRDCLVVVTGDFNCGEESPPYQALFGIESDKESPIRDTYRLAFPQRGENEGTFNSFRPGPNGGSRIDWIGASPAWRVEQAEILHAETDGRTPSDHHPVTAILLHSPSMAK